MTRTELIHSLISPEMEEGEFVSKSLRGNTLWTLWKNDAHYIVGYQLVRQEEGWSHIRETEETPPSTLTCPKKYLTQAAILCEGWRTRCEEYTVSKNDIKSRIRDLYNKKERGTILRVKLTAKPGYIIRLHDYALEEVFLYIVSVNPGIEGRFPPNGLRYQIPLRLVTDMSILEGNPLHSGFILNPHRG